MNNAMRFPVSSRSQPLLYIRHSEKSKRASAILADYLGRMAGCTIPERPGEGAGRRIEFIDSGAYGCGGFAYGVSGEVLQIRAGGEQAFVYAAYDLLEKCAGCMFFTATEEDVPLDADLTLSVLPVSIMPKLEYREVYYRGFEDRAFAEKHKMAPFEKHEGWGFWCHSMQTLIPNGEYFGEHPEYFAMIDGARHPKGEPCLCNPDVFRIVRDNLARHMALRPGCKYWSVSQNDDDLYCRCPACAARDALDGGPMGSLLHFVNRIAEAFPDKTISTLAYWYSRKAPRVTRPAKNVHIMLCNIEANRGLPIAADPRNAGTHQELLDWSSICGNVSLWDYCIQFANLVSPFPNLRVLGPNIRFFTENHVTMLFSQANREVGGEFCELRGYMLAKLMWDPAIDERAVMEAFCNRYYGPAGKHILEYIDALHDEMEAAGGRAGIFDGPQTHHETYLTRECMDRYNRLFDEAERAAVHDKALLFRVKRARLPVLYAGIVLGYGNKQQLVQMMTRFASVARESGLEKVEEWKVTVDRFLTDRLAEMDGWD